MPTRRMLLGLGALTLAATACGSNSTTDEQPRAGRDVVGMALPAHELMAATDRDLRATLELVRDMGCGWVRFDFYWDGLEPERDRFDWSASDRLVNMCRNLGLRVLGLLHTTPVWLRPPGSSHVFAPTTDEELARWTNFCRRTAEHFRGRVDAWEVWNEPNLIAFWAPRPDPTQYARLVIASWPAIREADPDALVVTGGPGGPTQPGELDPLSFLRGVLDAGAAGHFHAIALHPYTNLTGQPDGALGQAREVAQLAKERGLGEIPLWGTETGAPTKGNDGPVMSEAEQAELVRMTFTYWQEEVPGAGPLFWYTLRDSGAASRYETYGLVREDGDPKPGLDIFRISAGGQ
ncbi:cellulase family glycosylhydrolase [Luteococcus sp. Sow4_B9]|uniref:cellulase family glycosylhydrolase n=1 Tax=Luteococcus sp. Sow4_B9 TaxID=3438792 RepID=UPI003F9BDD3B